MLWKMRTLRILVLLLSLLMVVVSLKRGTFENEVIVSDFDGHIFRYNLNTSSVTSIPISDRGQGPEALDYDPTMGQVYWTNIRSDVIKRANLDGTNEQTLLRSVETPRGIAVDYTRRLLFYTEERDDIIGRINLTDLSRKTLWNTGLDRPLAITVDMVDEIIYWTDIGRTAKIEKMFYNKTKFETLLSAGMKWPIALSLDETRRNLYWCDGNIKKIQYLDLVTRKTTTVLHETSTHYYDVNYVDGLIYFIDLNNRNVFLSVTANGTNQKTYRLGRTLSKWRKIKFIRNTVCEDMSWGPDCSENCGLCRNGAICEKYDGYCKDGCENGYHGRTCMHKCQKGYFGYGCGRMCGHCQDLDTCDHVTGHCKFGCAAGWDSEYCNERCRDGTHGMKCESTCGNCRFGTVCEKSSGNCTSGCAAGWQGSACTEVCDDGTFGVNCSFKCQCCDGSACHKVTGQCPRKNVTQRICQDDYYGVNCSLPCGRCKDNTPCNESTGVCTEGCQLGWQGDLCDEECKEGFYGAQCAQVCQCSLVEQCDSVSGRCYGVWTPMPRRQVAPTKTTYYLDTPVTTALTVMVVVLVVLLIVAVVVMYRRRR